MLVLGVAWNGSLDDFSGFIDRHGLTFDQIDDRDGVLFAAFDVPAQPAYARLGPDGSSVTHVGTFSDSELLAFARGS